MPAPRRTTRPVLTAAVAALALTGLGAAFLAGTAVGPDQDQPRPAAGAAPAPAGPQAAALPATWTGSVGAATDCEDLLAWYVERGVDVVGPYGWDGGPVYALDGGTAMRSEDEAGSPTAAAPATSRVTSSATGTNVQEAGVDEPDVVKTDGSLLVRVQDGDLVTYDVTGADVVRRGSLALDDLVGAEILLSGDRVVAIGLDRGHDGSQDPQDVSTRVLVLDVSDPGAPRVEQTQVYDTGYVTARLHGEVVRLVLDAGLPDLSFVRPRLWRDERSALERNRDTVRATTLDDWLPHVSTDGAQPERVLGCDRVGLPGDDDAGLGTLAVVGLDPADPDTREATGLAAATDLAYFSATRLYLATTPWSWDTADCCDVISPTRRSASEATGESTVHELTLDGLGASYTASGRVEGRVADRWSMDEADGVLRLAVGATSATGPFNSVVTLRRQGTDLVELGRVDKLGPGEDIKAMRWFDGLAVMVTFRQVDPLYAVDLTDPARPRLIGELKIPGFSSYLHPLGSHRMIGLGEGPGERGRWGAQAGLFDVTDLTRPRRIDAVSYAPGTVPQAAADPRQLTWLPDERTVLSVVSRGYGARTGWVSVLRLDEGTLSNRMVEVEYGDEVDDVRLVPLPDGRVVLVTGDDASIFAL